MDTTNDLYFLTPFSLIYSLFSVLILIGFFKFFYDIYFLIKFGAISSSLFNGVVNKTPLEHLLLKFEESDKEFGSMQDNFLFICLVVLLSLSCLFFSLIQLTPLISYYYTVSLILIMLLNFFILTLPFSFFFDSGAFLFNILRGSIKTTSFNKQALLDFISLGGLFLRLAVQNIRLLLVLATLLDSLLLCHQFFTFTSFSLYSGSLFTIININNSIFNTFALISFFVHKSLSLFFFFFSFLHTSFILTIQLFFFCLVSVILFIFLYYSSAKNLQESFF